MELNMTIIGIGLLILFIVVTVGGIVLGKLIFGKKQVNDSQEFQN